MNKWMIGMVLCSVFFLFLAGCSEQIRTTIWHEAQKESYESSLSFRNHPATIILKTGDTVRGRFSKFGNFINLIHESPDSNRVWQKAWFATFRDVYYKQYTPSDLTGYIVDGERFDAVLPTFERVYEGGIPDNGKYLYMKRITPEGSQMKLYLYLYQDIDQTVLSTILFPPDTSISHIDYYMHYYLHFPDEPPEVAWRIGAKFYYMKNIRQRFRDNFKDCPALAETLQAIEDAPNNEYVIHKLNRPDSVVKSYDIHAILERIRLFEDCLERKKTKFQAPRLH